MKKEKNLKNILKFKNYQKDNHNGVIIWDEKNKNKIQKQLSLLNDLSGVSHYGNNYAVPSWFYLLNDSDLFNQLLEHPQFDLILNNNNEYSEHRDLLSDIASYPMFFNYDVKKLKKLIEKGITVDYRIFINLISHENYLLDLLEHKVLPLDENKIMNAGMMGRFNEKNMSIISMMINNIEEAENIDEKMLEISNAIERLLILGANPNCYYYDKLKGVQEVQDSYELKEYCEKYAPNFLKKYLSIQLKNQLSNELEENKIKKRNKI